MIAAARRAGVQVIWDLFHYGWPDDLDKFKPEFVNRFASWRAPTPRSWRTKPAKTLFSRPSTNHPSSPGAAATPAF